MITKEMLQGMEACKRQVKRFEELFPNGAEINEENALVAIRELDIEWLLKKLDKWEAYDKACATAWEAYNKACTPTWEAYNKACAPALVQVLGE